MINAKTLSGIPALLTQDFIRFKFHEGAGTTLVDSGGKLANGTIAGTATNIWDNPLNGLTWSGNNVIGYSSAAMQSFFDFTNYTDRLLVSCYFYATGIPTPGEVYIFSAGIPYSGDANGCISMRYSPGSGDVLLNVRGKSQASSGDWAQFSQAIPLNTPNHCLFDIDFTGKITQGYLNGVAKTAKALTYTTRPALTALSIGAVLTSLPSSYGSYLGGAADGSRVEELMFMKIPQSMAALIPRIAKDLTANRGDLSWLMVP